MKKTLILAAAIGLSACANAHPGHHHDHDDHIEHQMMQDSAYTQKRQQTVKMLEVKGYTVQKIEADEQLGKPVFDIEAVKNGQEYDITVSYPDLKILQERVDY